MNFLSNLLQTRIPRGRNNNILTPKKMLSIALVSFPFTWLDSAFITEKLSYPTDIRGMVCQTYLLLLADNKFKAKLLLVFELLGRRPLKSLSSRRFAETPVQHQEIWFQNRLEVN